MKAPQLAAVIEGHWTSPEAFPIVAEYAEKSRSDLAMNHLSDLTLANAQFMVDRDSLQLIGYQTAAKERIRWLSVQLAIATQPRKLTGEEIAAAIDELDSLDGLQLAAEAVQRRVRGISAELERASRQ